CYILLGIMMLMAFPGVEGKAENELNHSLFPESKWNQLIDNIEFRISSHVRDVTRPLKEFPVFSILLRYNGTGSHKVRWDDNFARVLWDGGLVLISQSKNHKKSTATLKFRTSNTYPSRKIITLKKGDEFRSTLNFKTLPGRYAQDLFNHKGKVSFRLWVKSSNNKPRLTPVSPSLILSIK
ncbi:MAG: hypothetical protein OEZ36_11595, partial [Spirochaetota bacterium]|nr:hypothetical protein [Spirochaetota bacterium]